jgi:hypothetical protein
MTTNNAGPWEGKPLDSPLHGHICDDERRSEVEDLVAESSPCVENSCVQGAGERTLSVGANGIGRNALLWLGACGIHTSVLALLILSTPSSAA